jgi:hypothetical protein
MISLQIAVLIVVSHFIADWLLQTRGIATTKSVKFTSLLIHLGLYASVFIPLGFMLFGIDGIVWAVFNILVHGLQDQYYYKLFGTIVRRFASNLNGNDVYSKKYFWDAIAVDQIMHLSLLFITIPV